MTKLASNTAKAQQLAQFITDTFMAENAATMERALEYIKIHGEAPPINIYWDEAAQKVQMRLVIEQETSRE